VAPHDQLKDRGYYFLTQSLFGAVSEPLTMMPKATTRTYYLYISCVLLLLL